MKLHTNKIKNKLKCVIIKWEDQNNEEQFLSKYKKEIRNKNKALKSIKKERKKDPEKLFSGVNLSKYVDFSKNSWIVTSIFGGFLIRGSSVSKASSHSSIDSSEPRRCNSSNLALIKFFSGSQRIFPLAPSPFNWTIIPESSGLNLNLKLLKI